MSFHQIPDKILVIGTGVFGLSTLWELMKRYSNKEFIVISPSIPEHLAPADSTSKIAPDAAAPRISSNDINRIIRPDYADADYAALMSEAMPKWRETPGLSAFYHESGLLLAADENSTAKTYVAKSLENVKKQGKSIELLDRAGFAKAMSSSLARATGDSGYLNERAGWADSAGAISWLWEQVATSAKRKHVEFIREPVERLVFSADRTRVFGAQVESGSEILADLTVLASGAWTPHLISLHGIASARGQVCGYIDVTDDEAKALEDVPVHFNMSHGCFFFPPARKESGGWEIKVARHAFGYSTNAGNPIFPDRLPPGDHDLLMRFLKHCLPTVNFVGRQLRPRICYYLDTASSNFVASRHPTYGESLFIATGGSGHGFKFLPVLGDRIVDILDRSDQTKTGSKWTRKWCWPNVQRRANGDVESEIWCHDGSRAGIPGVSLQEALAGDRRAVHMPQSKL